MFYRLQHDDCPVRWTAVQERGISREYPGEATPAADDALRVYHQFLWLPESIMPLNQLVSALRVVSAGPSLDSGPSSSSSPSSQTHPLGRLRALLAPLLRTPRSISQKYRTRVARLLLVGEEEEEEHAETNVETSEGGGGAEDELMWYALKHDKGDAEEDEDDDEEAVEERWRKALLDRMERREVMMQILVHFLLLTAPTPPESEQAPDVTDANKSPQSPSKKRKRNSTGDGEHLMSRETLEEQLEMLMDKLAMWQLMGSLDERGRGGGGTSAGISAKGKRKEADDRDWMQIFCEDVVEAHFRVTLPEQCDLLRSKVFQSSPFSEDSDGLDLASPPGSPKGKAKSLKSARAAAASRSTGRVEDRGNMAELSRTRSLSVTLAEERVRQRSRSQSIGPQKRALAREVSMTTAFKGKLKATKLVARANDKGKKRAAVAASKASTADRHGTTLVAATPVKPKPPPRTTQSQFQGRDRLPMLIENPEFVGKAVEGGADDDEWMIQSSPDILLLDDGDVESRILAEATPTKRRRS